MNFFLFPFFKKLTKSLLEWLDHSNMSDLQKNTIRSIFLNKLIYYFLYDEYLDNQLRRSSWSRESPEVQKGLNISLAEIKKWFPKDKIILDIGCGDGYILDSLQNQGSFSIGIDIHFDKLKTAKKYGNPVVQGDIHQLPFRDSAIDIIHCSHVLEHSLRPEWVLSELCRILKKQGKLLLVLPVHPKGSIKHPVPFSGEQDVIKLVSPYFKIERLWEAHTREPEIWAICLQLKN